MSNFNWEEVEVPRGAFISWGNTVGQHVTGKVLLFDVTGGTDFKGNPCPQLSVELVESAASISKEGERTDHPAGELVVLNCGQVSLRRAVQAATLVTGDLVKITLENLVKTQNGTVKEFGIQVARGAGKNMPPQQRPAAATSQIPQAAPPF